MKAMGLSLEQIALLLNDDLSAEALHGMLRLKHAELEQELKLAAQRLSSVTSRLSLIDKENSMPDYDVIIKTIPAQTVL